MTSTGIMSLTGEGSQRPKRRMVVSEEVSRVVLDGWGTDVGMLA